MVLIDIPMPQNCDDCVMNYDYYCCIITGTRITNEFDKERLPNCPLKEVREGEQDG